MKKLEKAKIRPGMRVVEPSAGTGHIADLLVETEAQVDVIEINVQLREILREKGHRLVGSDFLKYDSKNRYDRIVMNPPFSKGQDIEHVKHAYHLLKPGGIMVALMSEGPFFREDRQSREWRAFMESVDGYSEKLPTGSFSESDRQTRVGVRIVVLEKAADEASKSA